MKTTKDIIIASLNEALQKNKLNKQVILTESKQYGDYSTNLALTLQKDLGKSAMDIAKIIKNSIDLKKYKEIAKIEVAAPGFINF